LKNFGLSLANGIKAVHRRAARGSQGLDVFLLARHHPFDIDTRD
jgi:hypothetical protein